MSAPNFATSSWKTVLKNSAHHRFWDENAGCLPDATLSMEICLGDCSVIDIA